MAQSFTTTALLSSIRRRAMLPGSSTETFTDADLLAIATEELQTDILELWLSVREENAVREITQSITSGTASYNVPERAAAETLRQLQVLSGSDYVDLFRIEPEDVEDYGSSTTGSPTHYYFRDNAVVLVPSPSASGTLKFVYHRRPSALVATSAVATISSIDSGRTVITTTATIPTTHVSGITVDVVDEKPGFRAIVQDYTTTATTSGTTITVTTALPSSVAAGDYVCLSGESPVPQVPPELHPLLAQRTAMKALEAMGDSHMVQAGQIYEQMRERAMKLMTPRSVGATRYLINEHGPGFKSRFGRRR